MPGLDRPLVGPGLDLDWNGLGLDWTGRRTAWIRLEIVEDGTWTAPDLGLKGPVLVLDNHFDKLQDDFAYGELFLGAVVWIRFY